MTDYQFCTAERDGRLLIVTVNRPDLMNALHPPTNEEPARVFDGFAADPNLWVATLTGVGDLTSGWDLDKPVVAACCGART